MPYKLRFAEGLSAHAYLAETLRAVNDEPLTYEEATTEPDAAHWMAAIAEELDSHAMHATWTLVERPRDRRVIGSKWVFKIKRGPSGEILR